jgi:hypothetical protein
VNQVHIRSSCRRFNTPWSKNTLVRLQTSGQNLHYRPSGSRHKSLRQTVALHRPSATARPAPLTFGRGERRSSMVTHRAPGNNPHPQVLLGFGRLFSAAVMRPDVAIREERGDPLIVTMPVCDLWQSEALLGTASRHGNTNGSPPLSLRKVSGDFITRSDVARSSTRIHGARRRIRFRPFGFLSRSVQSNWCS